MAEQRRRRPRRFATAGDATQGGAAGIAAPPPAAAATLPVVENAAPAMTERQRKMVEEIAPPKPPVRQLSDRERAELRAKEILDGDMIDEGEDIFYFDPDSQPDGWTYEWKRRTVYGEENPQYQVQLEQNGWQPVPAARHPEMMPSTGGPYHTIERNGQILMERPKIITDYVRDKDKARARAQVATKEAQLKQAPPGTFERTTNPAVHKVNKSYEKIVLPQE